MEIPNALIIVVLPTAFVPNNKIPSVSPSPREISLVTYNSDFKIFDTYFLDMSQKTHFLTHVFVFKPEKVYFDLCLDIIKTYNNCKF